MNIYIDESGSFVSAPRRDAWNVVVAYALPETELRPLRDAVRTLKLTSGHGSAPEVKLRDVGEEAYFSFLAAIARLKGVVFCTATDAGLNSTEAVTRHRDAQAAKISEHVDKMVYEAGRKGVLCLAEQVAALSPQLCVQLYCQIDLMFNVVDRVILYFIERKPNALRHFRWRHCCPRTNKASSRG